MRETIAICPGSFDPITVGHIDIIRRASVMFDRVIVAIMTNTAKKPCFSPEQRRDMITRSVADMPNVEVDIHHGLLAEYVREKNAIAIVKGLRAVSDFEYEFQMALINKKLNEHAETVFLTTSSDHMYLSSSIVRSIASMGGDITDFVPACIQQDIVKRFKEKGEL